MRAHNLRVTFEHDHDADMSWLEQDHYNPSHPSYSPVYRTAADMRRKRKPIDGNWYRNPSNHVALQMTVERCCNLGEWHVVDNLGGIDFLSDSDDWATGTFYALKYLPKRSYLRTLAREAGLR